jgi:DNA-binding FadR family transcriptional regulator
VGANWPHVEPIKSTRIYQEIVRQIKTMVQEGRLKSGDRLPAERDLAERFKVSRASVREALRALQSMGLIEIRSGEGTFVREISVESLIEPLALVILTQREAVEELFEARRVLEPAIAGWSGSSTGRPGRWRRDARAWPRMRPSMPPSPAPPTTARSPGSCTR